MRGESTYRWRTCVACLLLAVIFVPATSLLVHAEGQAEAAVTPATSGEVEYRTFPFVGSRVAIWVVAELHLMFAAFVLAVPMFALIIEYIGYRTKDRRYDALAHEFTKLLSVSFSFTATLGALLTFMLVIFYPRLTQYLVSIFSWTFLPYALLFFAEAGFLYSYYYGWGKFSPRVHLALGLGLNLVGTTLMFIANAWLTFMNSPNGIGAGGELISTWEAVRNFTWMPINVHRMIANVPFGGSIAAAYGAFKFLGARTDEERAHYDWMGYIGNFIAISALLPLPFAGYWLGKEIYAYSQSLGIVLMGGTFSWLFIIQAVLIGNLFLAANYYLWLGMERIEGAERFQKFIKYLLASVTVCFLVWATPHSLVATIAEARKMGGAHHPVMGVLGVMSAKNTAVNILILTTFLSFLLYRRGNKQATVPWARKGNAAQFLIFAGVVAFVVFLGVYGYFVEAKVRIGLSVPQVLSVLLAMVAVTVIDVLMFKKAKTTGSINWGKMPARSQYALFFIALTFAWTMGLMGYVRAGLRQHWHVYGVMRDTSVDAFTPTLGFAAQVVSVTVLIFFAFIAIVFWLTGLSSRKDWQPAAKEGGRPVARAVEIPADTAHYDSGIVRNFAAATGVWGLVGFVVGLIVALKMVFPGLLGSVAELSYGRLRPLHTNAVLFAFAGNAIFMGVYYSLPQLCRVRMYSDALSRVHFWGWQAIIAAACASLLLGYSTGKEYAEFEWPIDIGIAIVWAVFGANLLGTLYQRRTRRMYVAVWFYLATFIAVAVLHVVGALGLPVSLTKSYPLFAGVEDALVQGWYGYNAVLFLLTMPFLGFVYYFLPKAADRPLFSRRLAVIHFWAMLFICSWAGPSQLLHTALPGWIQSLGTVFAVVLIAPAWGGVVNGLLTLRGAWDRVRGNPVLKFLVLGVAAYGIAASQGALLALQDVAAVAHYTDFSIGHMHLAAMAWTGGLIFAMLYYIVPQIYKTRLHSAQLADFHFWATVLGVAFYALPMYFGGLTQGAMWRELTEEGLLRYPDFLATSVPMHALRILGGLLFIAGMAAFLYNLWSTGRKGGLVPRVAAGAVPPEGQRESALGWHRLLETRPTPVAALILVAVLSGGVVEYAVLMEADAPAIAAVKPYTPLELEGRDIYIREGCAACHSQTVRLLATDVMRYGDYSKAGEFAYDHPSLWGSKRTGPDLHRVGGKYPDAWHLRHMQDPQATAPGSSMPAYPWLYTDELDYAQIGDKVSAMQALGVPYEAGYARRAEAELISQAERIVAGLAGGGIDIDRDAEIVALVAYLQRLGTDIEADAAYAARFEKITTRKDADDPSAIDPLEDAASLFAGKAIFEGPQLCHTCHRKDLGGQVGPNLTDQYWLSGCDVAAIMASIEAGAPLKGMLPYGNGQPLSGEQMLQVTSYILSLQGSNPPNAKAPDPARAQVCETDAW